MKLRIFCTFLFLLNLYAVPLFATEEPQKSWRILADKSTSSHDNQYTEAFGNVVLERGDDYIRAEYARYYEATKWIFLKGNVRAKFQGDFLKADEAEFDLATNNGWLKNGQVFLEDGHMYFSGAMLKKTGDQTYEFREAIVTACDGERPVWSIKTTRGDVAVGGYAHLWAPRFQIFGQPILASPYSVIPVKTKRQSGFLLPEVSTSEHLGFIYNQPYYQVIDEEQDLTAYVNYMSEKGPMLGGQYRIVPNLHTKGVAELNYLQDPRTESSSLFSDTSFMRRNNNERWWARGKFDGYLGDPDWQLKADLDLASDQDYLREFSRGYSGFTSSRKGYQQYFGRDIDDNDSALRTNRLLLSRDWADFGFQGLLEYTQDLTYTDNSKLVDHNQKFDPTLQRLPELNLNLYPTQIAQTPLTLEGSSQFVSFWREYGDTGLRLDVHPVLGLPMHSRFGSLIPKLGLRNTEYAIQEFKADEKAQSRSIPDLGATAYTEFARVFTFNDEAHLKKENQGAGLLKLRHTVQPRLEYTYIPSQDQEELPLFDELDRISAANQLTYSLDNSITTKSAQLLPDPKKPGQKMFKTNYAEPLLLRFEQSYDFREANRETDLDQYARRPFSDILADLTTTPAPWLALNNKTWFSPYQKKITEHEHTLSFYYDTWASAYFSLDFLEEIDEYLRSQQVRQNIAIVGGSMDLTKRLTASFLYRQDVEEDRALEKEIILHYKHQCFATEAVWSETDLDTRLEFRIVFAQLGAVGR